MRTFVKMGLLGALLGAGLMAGVPSASAQGWDGYGRGWGGDGGERARAVCSGERAHQLEWRLNRERQEGDLGGWQADRFHAEIDRLEEAQRHECGEGDWRAVQRIADRYDRIGWQIGNAAHGGWRRDGAFYGGWRDR